MGPERHGRRWVRASIVLAAVLVLGCGLASWRLRERVAGDNAAISRSHELIEAADKLRGSVLDLQIGANDYAVGGDEAAATRYHDTQSRIVTQMQSLRALSQADALQQAHVAALEPQMSAALTLTDKVVSARQQATLSAQAGAAVGAIAEELRNVAAIYATLRAIHDDEAVRLDHNIAALEHDRHWMQGFFELALFGGVPLIGLGWYLSARNVAEELRATGRTRAEKEELARRGAELERENQQRRATEEALRLAQKRLQTAMDVGGVGTWVWEASTRSTTGDDATRRLVGGMRADDPGYVPELGDGNVYAGDRAAYDAENAAASAQRRDFELEYRVLRADGALRWWRTRGRREEDANGNLVRMIGASIDITERKQAELLVAGQNQVLAMIAGGEPLEQSMNTLLRVVEDIEKDMLCSILLLDEDGVHVRPLAAPSLSAEYSDALRGVAIGPRAGSCGTAMYRRVPVVVTDIATDPLWDDYRALALPHGLRACWSTPVFDAAGQVLGAFAIYSREPGRPQPRHERVIRAVTRTAAIAIEGAHAAQALMQANDRLQSEVAERREAEVRMRTSQGLLQTALSHARMGTWILDLRSNVLITDQASGELFALPEEHSTDAGWLERFSSSLHPNDRERVLSALIAATRGEREYDEEFRVRHSDGQWRWMAARALLQRSEDGEPERVLGALVDITERKRDETLVAGQNRVLAMIAAGTSLTETLEALLSTIESVGDRCLAAVMLLDADGHHLHLAAAPTLPQSFRAAIAGMAAGEQGGSCGLAVMRRNTVICSDIATDPAWALYREAALAAGLRAGWSTPILDSTRRVIGTLAVYLQEARTPLAHFQHDVERATRTAAIAIESAYAAQAAREASRSLEREVVERRAAEAGLQEARAQLQSALKHARMGSWSLDLASDRLNFDESLLKVFGATDPREGDVPLERYLSANVHRIDQERVRREIEATVRDGADYDTEYRIFQSGQGVFWLAAQGILIRDADGRPLRLVGICRDISDQKQSEILIAGQNRVLAMIAAGAPLGQTLDALEKAIEDTEPDSYCCVWLLDEDAQHLHMASSKRGLAGRGVTTVIPVGPGGGPSGAAVLRREPVVSEDVLTDPLWEVSRDFARTFGIRACWSSPVFDSARSVIGTFALYSAKPGPPQPRQQHAVDIAVQTAAIAIESARAAQALREATQGLEQKVAERTRDLQAANERLKEVDRLKSQFLANMSHELRTPLNAILGFAGTLLMRLPGPLTADQDSQLGIIRSSAQHLLSLINDLLDLAKIESGRMALRVETVSCQSLLGEIAATLQPLADRKLLQLRVNAPAEPLRITTDHRALKQIVINLTNNAIKFTDKGGVTLGLRRLEREGRAWVELSVEDTGIGIRPADQAHLFEAFSQMDGTVREGTGLGLHLSQKFAQLIGGHIEFTSEYGKGSRFAVVVPGD